MMHGEMDDGREGSRENERTNRVILIGLFITSLTTLINECLPHLSLIREDLASNDDNSISSFHDKCEKG
jgi:hypothetical protein